MLSQGGLEIIGLTDDLRRGTLSRSLSLSLSLSLSRHLSHSLSLAHHPSLPFSLSLFLALCLEHWWNPESGACFELVIDWFDSILISVFYRYMFLKVFISLLFCLSLSLFFSLPLSL